MPELIYVTVKEATQSAKQRSSVLMLLHGVGSNERNMSPLGDGADPRLGIISVRGPLVLGANAYGWFPVSFTASGPVIDGVEAEAALLDLLNFIVKYCGDHNVKDVYLMGFSQGAIMATVAAVTQPARVQGAVALSGRFPKEFRERIVSADELGKTALWIGHGTEDQKLPIHHGRATQALLADIGAPFTYQEYEAGHTITPEMQLDAYRWLSKTLDARCGENGVCSD